MTREEIEKKMAEMEARLQELKNELEKVEDINPDVFVPEHGEKYWSIYSDGRTSFKQWEYSIMDKDRFAVGNVFRTQEDAEFEVEKRKVIHELRQYAEPKEKAWDSEDAHFYIEWDFTFRRINIDREYTRKRNCIYFDSVYMAEDAIKAVGEDRIKKYYLEVE